jgi:DNA-binding GntR family transcriptional regulator
MKIAQQETAVAAFYEQVPLFSATQREVLLLAVAAGRDFSIGELAHSTGFEKSSVSARLNKLRQDGLIEFGPERKCRISGITINPVRRKTT